MLIVRDADVDGRRVDVAIEGGVVVEVGERLRGDEVVDAQGATLLPGLHDHHVHVLALAASLSSVRLGPPDVNDAAALRRALHAARRSGSVRGIGYHESVAGLPDREALDGLTGAVPVRIQHRSGGLWLLNSAAIAQLGLDEVHDPAIERDERGRPTGRVWRGDALVRTGETPDVAAVGAHLAALGVTGVTDATYTNDESSMRLLSSLPQRVRVMGPIDLDTDGEVKVVLDDDTLPSPEELASTVRAAHARRRAAAVHCVTAAQLFVALHAFDAAGVERDRIEHAGVAPPEAIDELARLGMRVVTQPGFVAERGDRYRADVDPRDRPWLYPVRSLLAAGVPVAGSTDAPFTSPDPWAAMRAAVERDLGAEQRIELRDALDLFLHPLDDVAAPPRRVERGAAADLVLLDRPVALDASVVVTIIEGRVVHDAR